MLGSFIGPAPHPGSVNKASTMTVVLYFFVQYFLALHFQRYLFIYLSNKKPYGILLVASVYDSMPTM